MRILLLILSIILVSCSDISSYFGEPDKLLVAVEDRDKIEDVRKVLIKRFEENPVSIFSSVKSRISGGNIEFSFRGGLPDHQTINELLNTRGEMQLLSEHNEIILTSEYIVGGYSAMEGDDYAIAIELNEAGGKLLHLWTSRNTGKLMVAEFDGAVLMTAQIAEPLGKRIKISSQGLTKQRMKKVTMFLRSGSLKSKVWIVEQTISPVASPGR